MATVLAKSNDEPLVVIHGNILATIDLVKQPIGTKGMLNTHDLGPAYGFRDPTHLLANHF
jgi:hypothetical protein